MLSGYIIDHDGESGKPYTLFSAPDYPQVKFSYSTSNLLFIFFIYKKIAFVAPVNFLKQIMVH